MRKEQKNQIRKESVIVGERTGKVVNLLETAWDVISSLTLGKGHRLRVFENRVLRIFG
jgi:Zn finger protein HypA/HybF involved in hydrogenase expression